MLKYPCHTGRWCSQVHSVLTAKHCRNCLHKTSDSIICAPHVFLGFFGVFVVLFLFLVVVVSGGFCFWWLLLLLFVFLFFALAEHRVTLSTCSFVLANVDNKECWSPEGCVNTDHKVPECLPGLPGHAADGALHSHNTHQRASANLGSWANTDDVNYAQC